MKRGAHTKSAPFLRYWIAILVMLQRVEHRFSGAFIQFCGKSALAAEVMFSIRLLLTH